MVVVVVGDALRTPCKATSPRGEIALQGPGSGGGGCWGGGNLGEWCRGGLKLALEPSARWKWWREGVGRADLGEGRDRPDSAARRERVPRVDSHLLATRPFRLHASCPHTRHSK